MNQDILLQNESVKDRYGFTIIDNVVLMSTTLPNHSKILYVHLKNFYYKINLAIDLGVHKSFYVSRDELGRLMQMSASSVDGYMKKLKEAGLVDIKSQGIGKPNVYLLKELNEDIVDRLKPDISKWINGQNGSPYMVNDQEQPTETGSPYTVNDHVHPRSSQNTAKDLAEYGEQLNTKDKDKDIIQQGVPSNMSKQSTLFDLPSTKNKSIVTPQTILESLKEGKLKSIRKCQFVIDGLLEDKTLTDLDLCYYYQNLHKEIVGYTVSVNRTSAQARGGRPSPEFMEQFRDTFNLSIRECLNVIPDILRSFRTMCEAEKRKKADWTLHIGVLTWSGPQADIERIMQKVKPKVNEKYSQVSDKTTPAQEEGGDIVDEVF